MSRKKNKRPIAKRECFDDVPQEKYVPKNPIGFLLGGDFDGICKAGYISLKDNPEIVTACRRIADLVSSMTIYLMNSTKKGDIRIKNALSRKIDIEPEINMTRKTWMDGIVMNMLLYGGGNAIVVPHTHEGFIQSLEPIAADRVQLVPLTRRTYRVQIDNVQRNPANLLHFVFNPDEKYLWKGKGISVYLKQVAQNLAQAQLTENGFMSSQWKPSLIVKVDSNVAEFATPQGREKILKDYIKSAEIGEPWLIPGEEFQIEQVKPLSLADLAIKDTVELDKKTVASIIGVPAFLLGVGDYNQKEWNNFIQNFVMPICRIIEQELTKKLIINENWYFKFNVKSLYDWDLATMGNILGSLYDRGIIVGNEIRDRLGYDPIDGLDDPHVLENYIPVSKIGDQSKLN